MKRVPRSWRSTALSDAAFATASGVLTAVTTYRGGRAPPASWHPLHPACPCPCLPRPGSSNQPTAARDYVPPAKSTLLFRSFVAGPHRHSGSSWKFKGPIRGWTTGLQYCFFTNRSVQPACPSTDQGANTLLWAKDHPDFWSIIRPSPKGRPLQECLSVCRWGHSSCPSVRRSVGRSLQG